MALLPIRLPPIWINLLIGSTLGIPPRVNWVEYGLIWVKNQIAVDRGKIAQFYTVKWGP